MELQEQPVGAVMVVRVLIQRLDVNTSSDLKRAIADLVSRQHRLLVLDLGGVMFMDSVGLTSLVSGLKHVGPRGELVLARVTTPVRTLLTLSRMDKVFRIFRDVESAIAATTPKVR